ncbi:MAG TPA: acyl-CoA carboxylase subunit epsilon [Kineosporiaceae bacterium]|nr:acyl-CoA carboxylase subunit epsilon [Kineosporiaceae bacterium]
MSDSHGSARPTLKVISGDACPEEIAAILALVSAREAEVAHTDAPHEDTSRWATPEHTHRGVRERFSGGRHGWRTSYWPR